MKLRKSLITASIAAAVALGALGQAQASIYAGAYLEVDNLVIGTAGVVDPALPLDFRFTTTNTATLNGVSDVTSATCQGLFLVANDCNTTGNVLDAAPAQVGTNQADNTFSYLGPGNDEYARADSVIIDAELVNFQPSHTQNIAESELQTGNDASAVSNIQSVTGLTFSFTAIGPGTITVNFDADPALLTQIDDPGALIASAQAQVTFQVILTNDDTGDSVTWSPTTAGVEVGSCADATVSGSGDVSCTDQTVAESLNENVSVSTVPFSQDAYSRAPNADPGFGAFFASFNIVQDGNYTLSLSETKDTSVGRFAIPEPTTLLLLGSGLIGMGFTRRRARKA